MSILNDTQKRALFGALLGVTSDTPAQASAALAPERSAPTGTVAGQMPGFLTQLSTSRTLQYVAIGAAVLGVLYLARKAL